MYAIVRTGGKQYRVEEGRTITVERLPAEEGATVELGDVLLIADDGEVTVGTPLIEGARVLAQVEAHGRAKKIIVFKYKAKVRTRKKTGHRQHFSRLAVSEILRPGQQPKAEAKPKRRRKAAEAPAEAPAAEAAAAPKRQTRKTAVPAAEAGAPAAPKRRTRRKTAEAPAAEAPATPKRRTRRKTAEAASAETPKAEAKAKTGTTQRRSTRRKTEEETE